MKNRHLIQVMLCVNDHNGQCGGGLRMLEIGDGLKLEAMWWDDDLGDFSGPKFSYNFRALPDWNRPGWMPKPCRGHFQIGTRSFEFIAWKDHVGNFCWDMAIMRVKECLRMLKWLRRKGWFRCSKGFSELYDLWSSRSELKPKHLRLAKLSLL